MRTIQRIVAASLLTANLLQAAEFYVSPDGHDSGAGAKNAPFRTIQRAADVAQPGDTITVHAGIYRERIDPPHGGTSDTMRIIYQAAPGEEVVIKGSEPAKGWVKVANDTWELTLPDSFFGNFNPFKRLIHGDWFTALDRTHSLGMVYLDGHWLHEAAKLDDVLKPQGETPLWWTDYNPREEKVTPTTTIYAQFKDTDPNKADVEINARETVFYPREPGRDYITVRGFKMLHAAPNWAPPTAEQVGLIGTHWSKGWIIEKNDISYSRCVGITLGKYGDEWDNRAMSAKGYNETIKRALGNGWNKKTIGGHIVRNNHIHHCEQAGIVGSMGAAFSLVTNNSIHDINMIGAFAGAEIAGIKFHGAIDTVIEHNHIFRSNRYGIWLDWMSQGTRVTSNLLHDNGGQDFFFEVNHGPLLVDNNISLSRLALKEWSQGTAYVHNLLAGRFEVKPQDRLTPYHKSHSTEVVALVDNPSGDNRLINNLLENLDVLTEYDGVRDMTVEEHAGVKDLALIEKEDGFYLEFTLDSEPRGDVVTTERLGKTRVSKDQFENPDGSPLRIDTDYSGKKRNPDQPLAGPFAELTVGPNRIKVWPLRQPAKEKS